MNSSSLSVLIQRKVIMKNGTDHNKYQHIPVRIVLLISFFSIGIFLLIWFWGDLVHVTYEYNAHTLSSDVLIAATSTVPEVAVPKVVHLDPPHDVKGIYMSACVASTPSFRERVVSLVEETELNAIVIDVKDYTGTIAFYSQNPLFKDQETSGCRVSSMKDVLADLHERGIYTIARITVFQDPYYARKYPEQAVQRASDKGVWKDYKGLSFVDVGAKQYWEYIVALSKEAYEMGFDELNYDYIRFPSDGNMQDTFYPISEEMVVADPDLGKAQVLEGFFKYLSQNMKDTGAYLSADLFGMTMTNSDDLNIGQILEYALPYFDFIAPMTYPSHYPKGFLGYNDVNAHPYEIIKYSMDEGIKRAQAFDRELASTTPGYSTESEYKIRPWLQDNDYPVPYTPEMVRAQIQAVYDSGLSSWLLWDAGNTYTRSALHSAE